MQIPILPEGSFGAQKIVSALLNTVLAYVFTWLLLSFYFVPPVIGLVVPIK